MTKSSAYDDHPGCAMQAAVSTIMGKWKGVILFHLLEGTMRFNELARQMEGVTPRLLTKQLRELEADGLVIRTVYPVVPPKVEYSLTEEAKGLEPLLHGLSDWGERWMARRGIKTREQLKAEAKSTARGVQRSAVSSIPA
jgi:DNA-binding HxlR family transcriptional regulator|tara:strand:- start:2254 stop:2673 length:420 start_codon:yes stop_codon:yes gene_type:complete